MPDDRNLSPTRSKRWHTCRRATHTAFRTCHWGARRVLGLLFKLTLAVYFLFCALVLVLRYLVLPNIDAYKPAVERLASNALGNAVTIARIDTSWQGLRPRLSLSRVAVHDKDGRDALDLPQVSATLSWWTLIKGSLQLHQLEIDRPNLDISRDASGNLYVAGIPIDNSGGSGTGPDWVLRQHEIVIRGGRLRWNDHKRGAPELALTDVNLVLRNDWLNHRFALTATPPTAYAAPIDVRAVFRHSGLTGRISDPLHWKGNLYVDLRGTDLAVWKDYLDYPIELRQGKGAVRAWLTFNQARVADFTADVHLADVEARLRPDLPMLELAAVSGRISIGEHFNPLLANGIPSFGAEGHSIALTDFSVRTQDGLYLPRTTISENFQPAAGNQPSRTRVRARLIDLQTVANFAERLPLPEEQRRLLARYAPRGTLSDFSAEWRGSLPNVSAYSIKGAFAGLTLSAQDPQPARPRDASGPARAAMPGIPGVRNLSGSVDASERGGTVDIDSSGLELQLPGYLSEPSVPFNRLKLQAGWTFQPDRKLRLDLRRLEFATDGAAGTFSGTHLMSLDRTAAHTPGTLDLSGSMSRLDLNQVGRYLPLQTPEALRHWLSNALLGGAASDISVRIKGDLAQFPFRKGPGEFRVSGRIKGGVLDYGAGETAADGKTPLWPVIDRIDASILFDRARMEIAAASARTSGTVLSPAKAVIPDLAARERTVEVDGEAAGALQDFVRFTNNSPVAGWIGHFTAQTQASGNAGLALKLRLPLEHMADAKVQGSLKFAGNTIVLRDALPPLSGVLGRLEFTHQGFSLAGVHAGFLGGPVALGGGTRPDGSTRIRIDGSLTAAGIRAAYPSVLGSDAAATVLGGGTRYTGTVSVTAGHPQIVIDSSLAGLKLDFPAPLGKTASESLPLHFELSDRPSSEPDVERDEIRLSLGTAISAGYQRRRGPGDGDWQVVRGGIGVNAPAPEPDRGLSANVALKTLDVDAWNRALATLLPRGTNSGGGKGFSISQYVEPEALAARATELIVLGKKLDNVVVGASHQGGAWQANIDSAQASGYVTWDEPQSGKGLGKVTARLASLVIPKSAASDVTDLLEGKNTTTEMPALDIAAEDFQLFGKKFGRLDLIAHNAHGFSGREWRISKLSIVNPDGELHGTGRWLNRDGTNLSSLAYTLDIANAGRLLDRFGFPNVLRGGKGRMQGEINWNGLPFSIDIPTLSGQFNLNVASGQFLKVDPSAAKLLGVLSLQSLPRRLVLDFRDVFSEGFAFDSVTATASIAHGVAKTDNFKMRGVSATALIDGTADIAKEEQDLHVVVIPEINVGAASVVYGLAVNPVIGVGSFLAQLFLRDPLMKAFTFEYKVTGPWKDPVVKRLPRAAQAPAGDAARPAAKDGG